MPDSLRPEAVTGLILAGGQSSRMGRPKAWIPWQGRPLVEHVAERLRPQVSHHLFNPHPDDERHLPGWQVVRDARPGFPGPLAGMEAGLMHCPTPWLLAVPCDMPALPRDLLARLAACHSPGDRLLAARTEARHYPTVALLHRSLLPDIREHLDTDRRKLMDWHRRCGGKWCLFDDRNAFVNINRPQDLHPSPD